MDAETNSVSIDGLAFGGAGVGRIDGKVVFVPEAFPGDVALVKIEKVKKNYSEARLTGLTTPSHLRRPCKCPYVAECGGCPWMPLEYGAQLEWKRKIVEGQFAHLGGMTVNVGPTAPSPVQYGHRAKIRLKCSADNGAFKMGFCRPKSHDIVEIDRCAVACEAINKILPELRAHVNKRPEHARLFKYVKLEAGHPATKGRVTIEADGAIRPDWMEALLAECPSVGGAAVGNGGTYKSYGDATIETTLTDGMTLQSGPGLFSQVNPSANLVLLEKICGAVRLPVGKKGLDLFCGTGNITFPLSAGGANWTGVEFFGASVESARANAERLGISNVAFVAGDAGKIARVLGKEGRTYDAIVMDPPRGGAVGMAKTLSALSKGLLVYVSCYPPTLARDSADLAKEGFVLEGVVPLDMFPHTSHVESVAIFKK
ncbi:MAG: class I SAM-dependent RNA methyltransferase [Nitrospinae bacterium]|nr:class I SAM-dependent RNA methyltransferase [Nitrospinota bacterium]